MIRRSDDRMWLFLAALLLLVVALPEGLAQNSYPDRPIRIIVPSAPGGPSVVLRN